MTALDELTSVTRADVYKGQLRAAYLERTADGVAFTYDPDYLSNHGSAVAFTLAATDRPLFSPGGGVPAFFAGLLPEGRRLSGLRRSIKTSADDELSLLLAIGSDLIGNVRVLPHDTDPELLPALITVNRRWDEVRFTDVLGEAGVIDRTGIPGVQDKASATMISVPVRRRGERYIIKVSPPEYPGVVENEAFFLQAAKRAGLVTAAAELIHDADGRSGLLIRRFDRLPQDGGTQSLACEDACQVAGRFPADKYTLSATEVVNALASQTGAPIVAAQQLFRQFVFAWLTGNGDAHGKNFSILQNALGEWSVSPAYDLPNTTLYGDHSFALRVDGKTKGLSRRRFIAFAGTIGLPEAAAVTTIDRLLKRTEGIVDELHAASLPFTEQQLNDLGSELRNRRRLLLTT